MLENKNLEYNIKNNLSDINRIIYILSLKWYKF